jgi:hypothetical protein
MEIFNFLAGFVLGSSIILTVLTYDGIAPINIKIFFLTIGIVILSYSFGKIWYDASIDKKVKKGNRG